jgi:hypothetical protein
MNAIRYGLILLGSCWLAGAVPGLAWEVYKYRNPDGSPVYSHEPLSGGKLEEIISAPAPDSAQVAQALALKRKREEARANRIAANREADLTAVDAQIRNSTNDLQAAKRALEGGLTPLPGEIRGTAGRHTVLSSQYWQRVRALEYAVEDARERLDDAYAARNALK